MPVTSGRIALFVINEVDLSKRTTEGSLDQKRKVDTVEPCGNSPVIKVVGNDDKTIKLKGVLDSTVQELQDRYDAADVVPYSLKFQGANGSEYTGFCLVSDFSPSASGSKAAEWSATLEVTTQDDTVGTGATA